MTHRFDWAGYGVRLGSLFVTLLAAKFVAAAPPSPGGSLANSIGMKFVGIAAGEFQMGTSPDELARVKTQRSRALDQGAKEGDDLAAALALFDAEAPQHRVVIAHAFWLGAHEVTQREFLTVMGFNPSAFAATGSKRKHVADVDTFKHPVECVSWDDAVEFCRQLSSFDAEIAAGRKYRLPTEAEWEYTYRAGTTTPYFFGERGNPEIRAKLEYVNKNTSVTNKTTQPVGDRAPNGWGVYDLEGNVREWCADWFAAYDKSATNNPTGPATGEERVVRGNSVIWQALNMRSAARHKAYPTTSMQFRGFRVVCETPSAPAATIATKTAVVPAQFDAQLKQLGLMRSGALLMPVEEVEFVRFATTLERMRVSCLKAQQEVNDAKQQLQRTDAAKSATLKARTEARTAVTYSDTWREYWNGRRARKNADDSLAIVELSRKDVERWLADAQADFDAALTRFAEQCKALRVMHGQLQAKQQQLADDSAVKSLLASAKAGGKAAPRLGSGPSFAGAVKKLEYEESLLAQFSTR